MSKMAVATGVWQTHNELDTLGIKSGRVKVSLGSHSQNRDKSSFFYYSNFVEHFSPLKTGVFLGKK